MDSELWVSAEVVQADGTFTEDFFTAGMRDIFLGGTFEGDLWGMAANSASMKGACSGNVRIAATTVRIDGPVDGNLIVIANAIAIGTNAVIKGDAHLTAHQVMVEGDIAGSLNITATQVATLCGTVGGDAEVFAGDIVLSGNTARIEGSLTYQSDRTLIPDEQVIGGKLKRVEPASPYSIDRIYSHIIWYLAAVLTGIVFVMLFPITTTMTAVSIRTAPLQCMLIGFTTVFCLPMLAVIAVSSGIGVPLGAIMLAAWGSLLYIGQVITGIIIGTFILKTGATRPRRSIPALLAGLTIIYALTIVPGGFSFMIQVLVICTGAGALLRAHYQKRSLLVKIPEELKKQLIEYTKQRIKNREKSS